MTFRYTIEYWIVVEFFFIIIILYKFGNHSIYVLNIKVRIQVKKLENCLTLLALNVGLNNEYCHALIMT